MTDKRPYRMQRRAESRDETRRRILEAVMQLHEEVGPRATSISAIAERAGVQRLTVYRHFPDEAAVIHACSGEWIRRNPPPDPTRWEGIADDGKRIRAALGEFYGYYARTAAMLSPVPRDAPEMPPVQEGLSGLGAMVANVAEALAGGYRAGRARRQALATLRHALAFPTWEDLARQGLDDAGKVALVERWLRGIEAPA
jgi:AcrR family transcriptional regulator